LKGEEGHGSNSFEKYLALFNDRLLAALVFVAVENARVNYLVKYYYPGIKRSYRRMQEGTLLALSQVTAMTLRQRCARPPVPGPCHG
jgi:hypothetical protein